MRPLNSEEQAKKNELREKLIQAEGRKRVDPESPQAQFMYINGNTFAMSDTGTKWSRQGLVDLEPYGLINVIQAARDIAKKIGSR